MAKMIEGFDPTVETKRAQMVPNPFPLDLNGKSIGFLNTDGAGQRARIDVFLKRVEALLGGRYRLAEVVYRDKYRARTGQGASEEILDEMARGSDLIINGVGL
ncbi:MAG: hypothetical protein ABIH46_04320 [Chloroflexota bacterium]